MLLKVKIAFETFQEIKCGHLYVILRNVKLQHKMNESSHTITLQKHYTKEHYIL